MRFLMEKPGAEPVRCVGIAVAAASVRSCVLPRAVVGFMKLFE